MEVKVTFANGVSGQFTVPESIHLMTDAIRAGEDRTVSTVGVGPSEWETMMAWVKCVSEEHGLRLKTVCEGLASEMDVKFTNAPALTAPVTSILDRMCATPDLGRAFQALAEELNLRLLQQQLHHYQVQRHRPLLFRIVDDDDVEIETVECTRDLMLLSSFVQATASICDEGEAIPFKESYGKPLYMDALHPAHALRSLHIRLFSAWVDAFVSTHRDNLHIACETNSKCRLIPADLPRPNDVTDAENRALDAMMIDSDVPMAIMSLAQYLLIYRLKDQLAFRFYDRFLQGRTADEMRQTLRAPDDLSEEDKKRPIKLHPRCVLRRMEEQARCQREAAAEQAPAA